MVVTDTQSKHNATNWQRKRILIPYEFKTDTVCKTSTSTIKGILELFVPQYKVYMQEIVDQQI